MIPNGYSKSACHSAEQSFIQVRKVYKIFLNTRITLGSDFERMQSRIERLNEIHRNKNVMLYAEQKFHIYAVARVLFSKNSRCRTVFSIPDKKDIHLMGQ